MQDEVNLSQSPLADEVRVSDPEKGALQPVRTILQHELVDLPLSFRKLYFKPVMPKAFDESLLVHNKQFHDVLMASGSMKPISKIIELREELDSRVPKDG